MIESLPWHDRQWQRIEAMRESARIPHALMLLGARGLGKGEFASRLSSVLLCESDANPCGQCRGCRLMASGNHPDFLAVSPAEDKSSIGIEQIRALIEHVWLTSQYGGYKVVVVSPAELMTRQAANTLLKTLEEPPGAAVFILVTHESGRLPATIRSRCQRLEFPLPPASRALSWLDSRLPPDSPAETLLRLADGAPLGALEIAEEGGVEARSDLFRDMTALLAGETDPVAVASGWRGKEMTELARWLTSLTMDLIRLKTDQNSPSLTHEDLRRAMQPVARRLDLIRIFALLDVCLELRWLCARQTRFNPQLLLEDVAIRFAAAGEARS